MVGVAPIIIILISLISMIPYVIVALLKSLLWQFSFTARVKGFFTFSDILLSLPIHLNLTMILRIERISFSFTLSQKILKVSTYGFHVSLLLKDDFNQWINKKIELLQMLEDIRTNLKRRGLLKSTSIFSLNRQDKTSINEGSSLENQSENHQHHQAGASRRTYLSSFINKLFNSLGAELQDSLVDFFVYQDEEKKIEDVNIKKLYSSFLQNKEFQDESLCFRIFVPSVKANVKTVSDDDIELFAQTESIRLQSQSQLHKQGIITDVSILVKIPLDAKLAKDFCNYDLRFNIARGILNLNKKFINDITKFFVQLDTLKNVIKRVKNLILKLHYQDEMLREMMTQERMGSAHSQQFENYRDLHIPKRLKVVIQEGLTVICTDSDPRLQPFLTTQHDQNRSVEILTANFNIMKFELLRTLRNSYYVTFQSEKIQIDSNNQKAVQISNFTEDIDISFKKEITDVSVKESKMELINIIKADSIQFEASISLVKSIMEIVGLYKKMFFKASVKNKIMSILLNEEFLKTNLLHSAQSENKGGENLKMVLLLFREKKYKSYMSNEISFNKIEGKYKTYCPENQINLDFTEFHFKQKMDRGIEEIIIKAQQASIYSIKFKSLPILKHGNLQLMFSKSYLGEDNILQVHIKCDKIQVSCNLELILDITKDINAMTFVIKYFTRKWSDNYHVGGKHQITESLQLSIQELQVIWNQSRTRLVVFRLVDISTLPFQCPFKNGHQIALSYLIKKVGIYYTQIIKEQTIMNQMYCLPSEEKKDQLVIDVDNLEFKMMSTPKELKLKFNGDGLSVNLPNDLNLGAVIYEMVKQIDLSARWFRAEYVKAKRGFNFKYPQKNNQSQSFHNSSINYNRENSNTNSQQQTGQFNIVMAALKGRYQTLSINMKFKELVLQADDSDFKEAFVNKNEILVALQERDIYKCNPDLIMKLLKRLKKSKINEKAMIIHLKNFKFNYEIPFEHLEFNNVYNIVQSLDEAKEYINPKLFSGFDIGTQKYTCDYLSWHARNLQKPLAEIWDLDLKFLFINAFLNDNINESLFRTNVVEQVFKRFEVVKPYNKLVSKQFYDATFNCSKMKATLQGIETIIFFNDLDPIFKRLMYHDYSKSCDPRKQKLRYFTGLDDLRNRIHGKLKANVDQFEAQIHPRRDFNKFDSFLSISISDLFYNQQIYYQELCFRNFFIVKRPLKQFESALLKIPFTEIQLNMAYNQGKVINHYIHQNVQTMAQYLEHMRAYSSQEVEFDTKINIPSLGVFNDTDQEPLSSLMNKYVEKSPIPIFHYQRSHMKFLDSLYREYCLKKDYSVAILKRKKKAGLQLNQRQYVFQLRCKIYIGDIMALFSDFKDDLNDSFEESLSFDHKDHKSEKDKYLYKYNGLVFTVENLSCKSFIHVKSGKDGNDVMIKNSSFQCNFIRLAYLKYESLFSIRHKWFKSERDTQFESSLDNYKNFCIFFEIKETQQNMQTDLQMNSVMRTFKTLFPAYIVRNTYLQKEIILASLNPDQFNPYSNNNQRHNETDFVFTSTDTIGTLIQMAYNQDREIAYCYASKKKLEEKQALHQQEQNPLLLNNPKPFLEQDKLSHSIQDFGYQSEARRNTQTAQNLYVKHVVDVKRLKFLYTKKTQELITHHLVKGFNYSQFRKTDFIDLDALKEKQNLKQEYDFSQQSTTNTGGGGKKKKFHARRMSDDENSKQDINQQFKKRLLKRDALFAINLEDPQINFQNEVSKSQMLLATGKPTTAVIFTYSKCPQSVQTGSCLDELTRTRSGYIVKSYLCVVKYELQIQVDEIDIYVAPTVINLENPTFWMNNFGCSPENNNFESANLKRSHSEYNNCRMQDQTIALLMVVFRENLLRKVICVKNISFTFDFLDEIYANQVNAKMSIILLIESLACEMNGANMWHFVYVLKAILFNRGEKAARDLLIEVRIWFDQEKIQLIRQKEISTMKLDIIRNLVEQKLKTLFGSGAPEWYQVIAKKIEYTILDGEFKLFNVTSLKQFSHPILQQDKMFADAHINRAKGTHLIYKNREGKTDVDIDKIVIRNYVDSEEYRMALFPGYSQSEAQQNNITQETMIRVRCRDKFLVVIEAPWRIFDQFEVFIYPTSIQFTKNFFNNFKNFVFDDVPYTSLDNLMKEEEKYELLVSTKTLRKAQMKNKKKTFNFNGLSKYQEETESKASTKAPSSTKNGKTLDLAPSSHNTGQQSDEERQNTQINALNLSHQQQSTMPEFPIFFRYMRFNEIEVSLTYYHNKSSFINSKDLKLKVSPFIRHGKFITFKKIFDKYKTHCKKAFVGQIPSLMKQKFLQTKQKLGGFRKDGDEQEDEGDEVNEIKKEIKLENARRILLGDYYN